MKTNIFFKLCAAIVLVAAVLFSSCDETETILPEVTKIVITNPEGGKMMLGQGVKEKIGYNIFPKEVADSAVIEWSSSDAMVAIVEDDCVKACAPGNAVITAKCGNVRTTFEVRVVDIPVVSFAVPESLVYLYIGFALEVKLDTEPEKADISSLDWEYDKELVELSFKDGKVFFTGLKNGNSKVIVTSDSGESKYFWIIVREASTRVRVTYNKYTDSESFDYEEIDLHENDEFDWYDFFHDPFGGYMGKKDIKIVVADDIDAKNNVSVTSSDSSICQSEFSNSSYLNYVYHTLNGIGGFGTTTITVKVKDELLNLEHKLNFTLKRVAIGIPEEMVVTTHFGMKRIKDGDTISIYYNNESFEINSGYLVKWSVSGGLRLRIPGPDCWSNHAIIVNESGGGTVTVTDQVGKSMSFTVK